MNAKHFILWLPMIVLAFANATLRQLVLVKQFDELRAHQLSTVTLIILCAAYVWFVFPLLAFHSAREALFVGAIWVVLTVLFEFSLGRLTKHSWSYLLQDYNLSAGHIWPLFLLCLLLLPYVYFKIKGAG
ncbi:hypothetical protein [Pontibacter chitinilyticus]|uniref:hypothetical protein n=1 Tax=Pontibacter chitinilyticus TaxID=2674989 RepID=UPI00321964B7